MGTSQSSGGPESGVPLIPPWVPDVDAQANDDHATDEAPTEPPNEPEMRDVNEQVELAPPARFQQARRALGEFAQSGAVRDLRRGLGSYVRTGYGGAAIATRRMSATPPTARALFNAFGALAAGSRPGPNAPDVNVLASASASQVIDAIIDAIRPVDGIQDTEASRRAIRDALSDLLTRYPEADLLNLDMEQRFFAVESYTSYEIFMRFDLDLGQTIREKAPSTAAALARLREVRDFIKETVAASFRKLRDAGQNLAARTIDGVVSAVIRDTFLVFASYAE